MLGFFRKYQKFFFIIIAIVIIVSFTLFGVVRGPTMQEVVREDKKIGKKADGSSLMLLERDLVCELLGHSILDPMIGRDLPHLMNEGVLEKEYLTTGFAAITARHDFALIKPDLEKRIVKILSYRPYVHPQDPTLSAAAIYAQYAPKISRYLTLLQRQQDPLSFETFSILLQLYLAQTDLPPHLLKHVLRYEEEQRGLKKDPELERGFIGLFGFKTLEEWFGRAFLEKASEYVLGVAALAKKQGYEVTREEARTALYSQAIKSYQQIYQKKEVTQEDIDLYFQRELARLGVNEDTLVSAWQSILLFGRTMHDVGLSTFVDPFAVQSFLSFSREALNLELLEVKKPYRFKNLSDLFEFEMYLLGISGAYEQKSASLSFPKADSLDQIVRRAPLLVERSYEIAYAEVSADEVVAAISTKETLSWEEKHLGRLQKEFGFKDLESLSSQKRLEVDAFARSEILKSHPEKVEAALDKKALKTEKISIRAQGGKAPLPGMKDVEALKALIVGAPIGSEELTSSKKEVLEKLSCYSEKGELFYRIHVLSRGERPTLLSFEAAKKDGTLKEMLESHLEGTYTEMKKKKNPLVCDKKGKVLPLSQVKEQVGKIVFADLLKAIETSYTSYFKTPFKEGWADYRLLSPLLSAVKEISSGKSLPDYLPFTYGPVAVARSHPYPFAKERMFALLEGTFSPVEKGEGGQLVVYRVLGKAHPEIDPSQLTSYGHEMLADDARRSFILDLLKRVDKNGL